MEGAGSRERTEAPPSREEVEAMQCVERSSSGTRISAGKEGGVSKASSGSGTWGSAEEEREEKGTEPAM